MVKLKFMQLALCEAQRAYDIGEIPVGAVIIQNNQIIAKAYNQKEKLNNVTAHAEILAIQKASKKLKNWRLTDCDLYVTLEPCAMCLSAIIQSRIKNLIYALDDKNAGAISYHHLSLNNICHVYKGILKEKSKILLQSFFIQRRKK